MYIKLNNNKNQKTKSMKLLKIIHTGIKGDEMLHLKTSLISKRSAIQKQINNYKAAIQEMEDNDEIALPESKLRAEIILQDVLLDTTSDAKQLLAAYVNNKAISEMTEVINPTVIEYKEELNVLRGLL